MSLAVSTVMRDKDKRMSTMDLTHCSTNRGHYINAILWIDGGYKENDEDLSSIVNTFAPTRRIFKLYHLGRLSNFGKHKLTNIMTSGRSKKPQKQCRACIITKKKEIDYVPLNKGMF
ncbi:piggyBac transposable element-derived protein 4-like [Vespula squamosa]|uniref:PiggyBac transposable element-derived protein 4-like n=1 Tax=Vespula squamosa TaxID=30214 RepID=A0ABD2BH69_VESSQ